MATAVQPHYIALRLLKKESEGVLEKTEESREKEIKKQNHGTVVIMGAKCDQWIQPGDVVSFYRNAATPVFDGVEELQLVHEDHVLVKL